MVVSFSFLLTNKLKPTLTLLGITLVSVFLFTNSGVAQNDDKFDCPLRTWPPSLKKAHDDLHTAIKKMPHVTIQVNQTQATLKGSADIDAAELFQEALKTLKAGLVPSWGVMSTFPFIGENFQVCLMVPFFSPLEDCSIKNLAQTSSSCTITPEIPLIPYSASKLTLTLLTGGTCYMSSPEGTSSFSVTSKSVLLKDPRLQKETELFIREARKCKAASRLKKDDEDFRKQIQAFKEKLRALRQQKRGQ